MFLYIMGHLRELYINLLLILSISVPAPIHLTCFSEVRTRCYPGSDALTTERLKKSSKVRNPFLSQITLYFLYDSSFLQGIIIFQFDLVPFANIICKYNGSVIVHILGVLITDQITF